jgi:hypothetical protein
VKYRVTCPDGVVRHELFDSNSEACTWAAFGHACYRATTHKIEEFEDCECPSEESAVFNGFLS